VIVILKEPERVVAARTGAKIAITWDPPYEQHPSGYYVRAATEAEIRAAVDLRTLPYHALPPGVRHFEIELPATAGPWFVGVSAVLPEGEGSMATFGPVN